MAARTKSSTRDSLARRETPRVLNVPWGTRERLARGNAQGDTVRPGTTRQCVDELRIPSLQGWGVSKSYNRDVFQLSGSLAKEMRTWSKILRPKVPDQGQGQIGVLRRNQPCDSPQPSPHRQAAQVRPRVVVAIQHAKSASQETFGPVVSGDTRLALGSERFTLAWPTGSYLTHRAAFGGALTARERVLKRRSPPDSSLTLRVSMARRPPIIRTRSVSEAAAPRIRASASG